jgi:hypothetical protein
LKRSLERSTQLSPQALNGAEHATTQLPASQNGVMPAQMWPQVPQSRGSLMSERQTPSQNTLPSGQSQSPLLQLRPLPQMLPQAPQFSGSVSLNTQLSAQASWPGT